MNGFSTPAPPGLLAFGVEDAEAEADAELEAEAETDTAVEGLFSWRMSFRVNTRRLLLPIFSSFTKLLLVP